MGGRRGKAKARERHCLATGAKCLSAHRFFERHPALRARHARQECRKSTISGPNSRDSRPQRRAAMSDDDEFTPRLGRQRQQGGKRARRYLGRVVGAAIRSAEKGRSEEPTPELQSLMRISYAVFCLNKKKNTQEK